MTNLCYGAHCAYNINIHLALVVAYRRKAITKTILDTIQEVLHRILDRLEIRILEFTGKAGHIHILISIPPRCAVSDLVNRIKTATSKAIRKRHCAISLGKSLLVEQLLCNLCR
ncbi:MAG: IS200/IS605 family transposase [Sutterella wadsworthensis]|nr:IS200/IS605 family transposase [Sutterella wadsworthensis]